MTRVLYTNIYIYTKGVSKPDKQQIGMPNFMEAFSKFKPIVLVVSGCSTREAHNAQTHHKYLLGKKMEGIISWMEIRKPLFK